MIKKMNKKAAGMDKEEVHEEPDTIKAEDKHKGTKESTRKRPGRTLKMMARKNSKRQRLILILKKKRNSKPS